MGIHDRDYWADKIREIERDSARHHVKLKLPRRPSSTIRFVGWWLVIGAVVYAAVRFFGRGIG